MTHTPLIALLVGGLGLAFLLGTLANRLRVPPLVGYLLAGVLIGPHTPGFVADPALARQLAELGVVLLMFGTGLHFSVEDLLSVKATAVPGALGQMLGVAGLGFGLTQIIGWPVGAGVVFGMALSVASTVVVLRGLQERRLLESERGRVAVGWLVVQDLVAILALVLLPAISAVLGGDEAAKTRAADGSFAFLEPDTLGAALGLTLAKVVTFFAVMVLVGRRLIPWILHYVAHTGSRELFRLAVLAIALGVAFGAAELFDVSFALGAVLAGMMLAESQLSQSAAQETLPLRDAFAVLFFVSVGMLFDPSIVVREPLLVSATFLIIVAGNAAAASFFAGLLRSPLSAAVALGVSLAQIGEFSFILAELGSSLKLLPDTGRDLILAGAILSIAANPLLLVALDHAAPRLRMRERSHAVEQRGMPPASELPSTTLVGHAVLVGHGRVGSLVADTLASAGQAYLVIEEGKAVVAQLRARGTDVILGNAAQPGMLEAANIASARWLISAIPNPFESANLVEHAHAANPSIEIIARAHSEAEVEYLKKYGASLIIMGEQEIARRISEHILSQLHEPRPDAGVGRGP